MNQPLTAAVRYLSGEREPVRVATTGNITLQGLQLIDDVELEVGDRVLVKDQTDQAQNGIWLASEGVWPRAPDASYTRAIDAGVTVAVREGSAGNGKTYRFSSLEPVVGIDPITLTYFLSDTLADDVISDALAALAPVQEATELARDEALAAASSLQPPEVDSRAFAIASYHPIAAPNKLRTAGYATAGDKGGARYRKVVSEPSHGAKLAITLSDGVTTAWYENDEEVVTPKMVGVVFNSAIDQTSAFQLWVTAITALGVDGWIPRGVIKVDGAISTSTSDLNVQCHPKAVLDASAAPINTYTLTFTGSIGSYSNITVGNAQEGATRIRTSAGYAQSLAIGDVVKIKSANVYDSFNTASGFGELNVVTGLVDAATGYIDLERPLSATYSTTPQVAKITPIRGLRWGGVKVIGAIAEQNNQRAIRVIYAKDFILEGISAERMDDRAFWIQDSLDGEIIPGMITDARPSSTGYGVSVIDACSDIVIHHGSFQRVRHAFSTNNQSSAGGIPRRITFADSMVSGGAFARGGSMGPGDAIDTHGAAEQIYIERNTVTGCPGQGINFECRSGAVRDNKVIGSGSNGISVHNESDFDGDVIVSGNKVSRCVGKGIYAVNGTRGTTAVYQSLLLQGNSVDGATAEGIQIGYSTMLNKMVGMIAANNRVRNSGAIGLYILHQRRASITGNNVDGLAASNAMRLYDCLSSSVAGANILSMPGGATVPALLVTGTTAGASANNTIAGNIACPQSASITGAGISLDNNVQWTNVVGNNVRGTAGVSIGTGTGNAQADNL